MEFQYRKRYEVTCDRPCMATISGLNPWFQYRKRYEVTCDRRWYALCKFIFWQFQYRKRYEVTCDFNGIPLVGPGITGFNTASGMRSHVTQSILWRRYTICSFNTASGMRSHVTFRHGIDGLRRRRFNTASGMRSHVTCKVGAHQRTEGRSFNTASGMRSHVTTPMSGTALNLYKFQYRKRYEVTCDLLMKTFMLRSSSFQYRKRYEVTCDVAVGVGGYYAYQRFNTASGMRSHVT